MIEPFPIVRSTLGDLKVRDSDGFNVWFPTEKAARRYAALPVILAAIRDGCSNGIQCAFCGEHASDGVNTHETDCPGIAALSAAGEEIDD